FTARAPCVAAYVKPSAIVDVSPTHSPLLGNNTRIGISFTCCATPVTPYPSFPEAPMIPATWVPCPHASDVLVDGGFETKLIPVVRFGFRSGCKPSTPESATAMITELLPVVMSHAAGA